ncbi:MAG: Gfo/Idh/MocA family oxidoreductase [Deltaproteobacteria bacterium]|nr:Gfo/Idh/MocA family oxidoreductase [Deltaproteobacteria bacterium]
MSLGWGIVGIGRHADRFVAQAISHAPDTQLVAVCSRDIGRAQDFAARHQANRAYSSFDQMLQDPAIDVLYIATPNKLHLEQTVAAAQAGKHVFCEKPMALSVAECEKMIRVCADSGVKLGIDLQNRYHPAHIETHRLISSGEAGEINFIRAQYAHGRSRNAARTAGWRSDPNAAGAGAIAGTGIHPIDLLRYLTGSEIVEVRALLDEKPPQLLDTMAYVILSFANGITGIVVSGLLVPRSDDDAVVYGSRLRITCKGTVGMPLRGELIVEGEEMNRRETYPTDNPGIGLYVKAVGAFNQCIRNNTAPLSSGYDGLEMVRIVAAIQESSRTGKAVKISR